MCRQPAVLWQPRRISRDSSDTSFCIVLRRNSHKKRATRSISMSLLSHILAVTSMHIKRWKQLCNVYNVDESSCWSRLLLSPWTKGFFPLACSSTMPRFSRLRTTLTSSVGPEHLSRHRFCEVPRHRGRGWCCGHLLADPTWSLAAAIESPYHVCHINGNSCSQK